MASRACRPVGPARVPAADAGFMAFFKFRQRGQPQAESRGRSDAPAATGPQETIDGLRRRARHRLLGAAVLVLVAVIGFPLLFDTQPRPAAVDAPITIPDKDQVAPLQAPAPSTSNRVPATASLGEREEVVTSTAVAGSAARTSAASAAPPPRASERPAERSSAETRQAAPPPRPAPAASRAATPDTRSAETPRDTRADDEARVRREAEARAKREEDAKARRAAADEAKAKREAEQRTKREEAARARALLEGRSGDKSADAAKDGAASDKGRFVIQVGAFSDAAKVREVRQQAERAGVKTYTQVVDTPDGKRTRVRVGPYATRVEADKAAAALKKAGLAGSILSL